MTFGKAAIGVCFLLMLVQLFVFSAPRDAEAHSLLCTNSDAFTENTVTSISEFLSQDSSSLTVFENKHTEPKHDFDEVYIIDVIDQPGIISSCGEFAGVNGNLLQSTVNELRSEIGETKEAAQGLPAGITRSAGRRFSDGEQLVFVQVTSGSGAIELLIAIVTALDGSWTECSANSECLSLIERW